MLRTGGRTWMSQLVISCAYMRSSILRLPLALESREQFPHVLAFLGRRLPLPPARLGRRDDPFQVPPDPFQIAHGRVRFQRLVLDLFVETRQQRAQQVPHLPTHQPVVRGTGDATPPAATCASRGWSLERLPRSRGTSVPAWPRECSWPCPRPGARTSRTSWLPPRSAGRPGAAPTPRAPGSRPSRDSWPRPLTR